MYDPHPTRRSYPRRTEIPSPPGITTASPGPPGDGSALLRRLVAGSHRHPSGLLRPTVRSVLKDFLARGTAALFPRRTGPPPDLQRRQQVTRVADRLARSGADLDQQATGHSLGRAEHPIERPAGSPLPRDDRRRLEADHQLAATQAESGQGRPGYARAEQLEKKASAGRLKLYYLDECGFAPTLPTAYSWSLPRQRKRIDYESPQGRRVNAMAAYRPYDISPRLEVFTAERTWDSYDLLGFLGALPRARVPRVVVLDNAGLHTSHVIRRARRDWLPRGSTCTSCRRMHRSSTRSSRCSGRSSTRRSLSVVTPAGRVSARQLTQASTRTGEASNQKVKRNRGEPLRRPVVDRRDDTTTRHKPFGSFRGS